jgi:circadian clock protein KaiC
VIDMTATDGRRVFDRISTGLPELDGILGGGIPKNSINIVMGHPGTGKTIFAEQLAFHNANSERPILYLTTLSEPLSKVMTYLQGFTFYDESKLLGQIIYEDIGAGIADGGLAFVVEKIRSAIRETGPQIVVVDSFKAVTDLGHSMVDLRRTLSDLAGILTAYDTTVFLIGEYTEDQIPLLPEFAVADGIIGFARRGIAKRDERFLRIFKLRGSAYAEGLHSFKISQAGLHVFPRLVTPTLPAVYHTDQVRVKTGIPGLDDILDGGFWQNSTVLCLGRAGTGKTTLALQFALAGGEAGQRSLYVNFQENPTQLARAVAALGVDLDEAVRRGLYLHYESPVELRIDSVVVEIFKTVREQRIQRVVIDALGDLALAAGDRERFHDYLYSLCQHLIVNGATTLMTMEVSTDDNIIRIINDDARFSSMSDSIIELNLDMQGAPHADTARCQSERHRP